MSDTSTGACTSQKFIGAPGTVVVLGSGCSLGLGVPTLAGFLDHAFALLLRMVEKESKGSKGSSECPFQHMFSKMQCFIERIKGFGGYMHLDLLNMEELYGLAAMWEGILDEKDRYQKKEAKEAKEILTVFKRVLFLVYHKAGIEFLDIENRFDGFNLDRIRGIKRESRTELLDPDAQVSLHTNLMAYLGLASYRDDEGYCPAVIQFNWDLAFDRALWLLNCSECKEGAGISPWTDFESFKNRDITFKEYPLVIRPHGGLNWVELPVNKGERKKITDELKFKLSKTIRWDGRLICDKGYINTSIEDNLSFRRGERMLFVPPSWKKDVSSLAWQWRLCQRYLERARRIVFIGYSLPPSDMNIRYFLALALANNNLVPKVYVWNPGVGNPKSEVRANYLQLFQPLARSWRLLGIPYKFGHPGLFDLERALKSAEPILP